jgi:hypothetical protein
MIFFLFMFNFIHLYQLNWLKYLRLFIMDILCKVINLQRVNINWAIKENNLKPKSLLIVISNLAPETRKKNMDWASLSS